MTLEHRLDRLGGRTAERVQDRDVALDLVERLDVPLRLVAGVLDGELDLPALDAATGVEGLEEGLMARGDGLAERRGRAAERVEVTDADRLGRSVDAGSRLDRACGGGTVAGGLVGVSGAAAAEGEACDRRGGHCQDR
jgi:hypothetical protein